MEISTRNPRPVMSVTAGAALYRRSAFQHVGLFDEDFVTYHEDIDWGLTSAACGDAILVRADSDRISHRAGDEQSSRPQHLLTSIYEIEFG